jgi:hypothetical protein
MSKRFALLALAGLLSFGLASCGSEPQQEQKAAAAPAPETKKEEPPAPTYDITKESLTDHQDWTSKNVSILGAKLGDTTNNVVKNFGAMDNTRTLPAMGTEPAEYLTIYQGNGLFVYTQQANGKLRKFEIYGPFAKELKDEKLKKLLTTGDLKTMHDVLGQEEKVEENSDTGDPATEYVYDARGIRFVKYKAKGQTVNAIRFSDFKKAS